MVKAYVVNRSSFLILLDQSLEHRLQQGLLQKKEHLPQGKLLLKRERRLPKRELHLPKRELHLPKRERRLPKRERQLHWNRHQIQRIVLVLCLKVLPGGHSGCLRIDRNLIHLLHYIRNSQCTCMCWRCRKYQYNISGCSNNLCLCCSIVQFLGWMDCLGSYHTFVLLEELGICSCSISGRQGTGNPKSKIVQVHHSLWSKGKFHICSL